MNDENNQDFWNHERLLRREAKAPAAPPASHPDEGPMAAFKILWALVKEAWRSVTRR